MSIMIIIIGAGNIGLGSKIATCLSVCEMGVVGNCRVSVNEDLSTEQLSILDDYPADIYDMKRIVDDMDWYVPYLDFKEFDWHIPKCIQIPKRPIVDSILKRIRNSLPKKRKPYENQ